MLKIVLILLPVLGFSCQEWSEKENTISVLSFNVLALPNPARFGRIKEVIRKVNADVVALQEANLIIYPLAKSLGLKYNSSAQVLSKYELKSEENGAVIANSPNGNIRLHNVHLRAYPYGPYLIRDGEDVAEVVANEEESHVPEIQKIITDLDKSAEISEIEIIAGDFNVPSHLDWVESVQDLHFNRIVSWPVSIMLEENGFRDTYREFFPNPRVNGNTWTPIHSKDEVHDRIDFIYLRNSSAKVVCSKTLDNLVSPWPSDHRAVWSVFQI